MHSSVTPSSIPQAASDTKSTRQCRRADTSNRRAPSRTGTSSRNKGHKRVERGPYKFMRRLIYTNHLLDGLGTAMASGLLVAFAGLASFVRGFWIRLNQEERFLLRSFPNEYHTRRASRCEAPLQSTSGQLRYCQGGLQFGTVYWENRDAG